MDSFLLSREIIEYRPIGGTNKSPASVIIMQEEVVVMKKRHEEHTCNIIRNLHLQMRTCNDNVVRAREREGRVVQCFLHNNCLHYYYY